MLLLCREVSALTQSASHLAGLKPRRPTSLWGPVIKLSTNTHVEVLQIFHFDSCRKHLLRLVGPAANCYKTFPCGAGRAPRESPWPGVGLPSIMA